MGIEIKIITMKKNNKPESLVLRQKAEGLLKNKHSKAGTKLSEVEALRLIHELEVHQVELEMQKEELILAQEQATLASEKYIELYDFAPSGYFTLSPKGEIIQLNLAGAAMLGKTRLQLKNQLFHVFVSDNSKPFFLHFLEKVFSRHEKEICELTLSTNTDKPVYVHISGIISENGGNCFLTVIDITERKLLESNVVERMILLRETEKAGKIGGWTFDIKTSTQTWTNETFKILEIETTKGEPKVPEGIEYIDELYRHKAELAIKRAIEFGEPYEQEWKVTTAKGNLRWVNVVGKAKVVKGKTISLFGSFQDITDKKQAEASLLASEIKYHAIFDNVQDVFYQTDLAGTVLEVSPSIENFLGFSRDEIIGKSVAKLSFDFKSRDMFFYKLKENGELRDYELRLKTKTGEFKYTSINARLIFDANGKPNHIDGAIRDITHRKLAQVELQASKDFLNSIINAVASPVFVKDDNHKYVLVNNAYCSLLEIPMEKIIGSTDSEYFPEAQLKVFIEKDNEVFKTGRENINEEYLTDGIGNIRTIVTRKTLYTDTAGNKFLVGVINDITKRKLAEIQINKLNRVYSVLSNINQSIVRNRDKQLLFDEACRITVDDGGFIMALIGVINSTTNKIDIVASSGKTGEFINDINIDLNDKALNSGPAGIAIKTGKCNFSNNIETDDREFYWRDKAFKYGYRSLIALPLTISGKTIGVYMIYSGEIDFFNEDEIKLLNELASDISFALEFIENEKERKQTEEALRKSEAIQSKIVSNIGDVIVIIDQNGINRYKSPNIETLFGWKPEEMVGKSMWDVVHPDDLDSSHKIVAEIALIPNATATSEIRYRRKDGVYVWIEVIIVNLLSDPEIQGFLGNYHDITDRRLAQEKIREKDLEFKKLSSNLPDLIFQFTRRTDGTYYVPIASDGIKNIFGCSPEDVINDFTPIGRVIHPDDVERVIADIEYSAKHLTFFTSEFRVLIPGKPIQWIYSKSTPEKLADGSVTWYGFNADITDRKRGQEKLLESDERFNLAMKASKDGLFDLNLETSKVYYSPGWKKIIGYKDHELPNDISVWEEATEPLGVRKSYELHQKLISKEITRIVLEFKMKHKDGHWVDILSQATAIFNKDGKAIRIVGTHTDISERKKAEESLMKLKTAIEKSEVSVVITDRNGIIEYANPFFTELSGFTPDEYIGNSPGISKSEYHTNEFYENLWNTILSGRTWEGEFYNCKKNGEMYWENAIITPIENDKNEITHFVAVKTDITNTKNINSELLIAKEHAEESDRLKSAFLANMSHEIRTPMNGILGFTELLKEPDLSDVQQKYYISIIEKSGARLLNIINDIIDISKIESGLMKVKNSGINVNEYLDQILTFFKPEAEAKNIKLICKPGLPREEAFLETDSEKFYAILTNLVKNALKYTETGFIEFGYVVIETRLIATLQNTKFLQFFVKDTGIGIPKDRQEAIFERFIQADITDKMAWQGAGLGLSISKAYVEMMRGKIWVESEEENLSAGKSGGSTFYFTLPNYFNPIETSINTGIEILIPAKEIHSNNLKILIAEDDEPSSKLASIAVMKFGKNIIKTQTGKEAVETCRNNPDIDLVLMDIQMPKMNGYEATRQIRQFNTKVIIIAITAFALTGDKEKSIEAGCNDYISKPIKRVELQKLIDKYFNG